MNIFETLPSNFFNIFTNNNRDVMSECLSTLYEYMKDDASFASLKENVIFELSKYFNTHITDFEIEDSSSQNGKDKALYVYRRLKECGWINEEVGDNYQIFSSFEDYAITIMETIFNLDNEKNIEYSSMVYNIFLAFNNFDIANGYKILEAQYNMSMELMLKLKNLNTNIKRYIRKLLTDSMKNDINQLLDSLLSEYQLKIVDRAFYNLTTRDNPMKYRNSIINTITSIQDSEANVEIIVRNIMESKDIDYNEAYNIFSKQTNYMIDAFENIMEIISEISSKNESFVSSATNRILFLINVKEDIGGKINEIIKEAQGNSEILSNVVKISTCKNLDSDSLYTPRSLKKAIVPELLQVTNLDEEFKAAALEKYTQSAKYTQKNIENNILALLKKHEIIKASELLEKQKDISLFILSWLYGYSVKSKYIVEPCEYSITYDNYVFRDFIIRER